jgi:hypothetical protein
MRGLGSQHYGVGALLLGGGNECNWRAGWTDIYHPKIKDLTILCWTAMTGNST